MKYWLFLIALFPGESIADSRALDAEYYNKNGQWQYATAVGLLDNITINGNEAVLDIGSGDGKVAKEVARRVPEGYVLGIDVAPDMVRFSESHKGTVNNLSYQLLSAENLVAESEYDLITSFSALYWIKNQDKALKQLFYALKPGGQIFFMVFPKESLYWQPLISVLESPEFMAYCSLGQHLNFLSTDDYENKLNQIGFKSIEIKEETLIATYTNKEDYINYVRGWSRSFVHLATASEEDDFLELVYQKAREKFETSENGNVLIPYKKVILTAKKRI